MRKQFKTLSALMLSAVLAVSALPFSKVEAKSKWVEINGVNYEINRITGECEASLNVKKGKSEVRIPNKVKYQGDTLNDTLDQNDTLITLILEQIKKNPRSKQIELAEITGSSIATIKRTMKKMTEQGIIQREGGKRNGIWIIVK